MFQKLYLVITIWTLDMTWQDYQEKVAKVFRKLDCLVVVNAIVEGVRAKHDIDIWVRFTHFGIESRWVIECKYWKTPIPKEKALVLKQIVEDVGADRGIVVTELGFQKGAFDATRFTNVLLTTLTDLEVRLENDIQTIILDKLERKSILIVDRIHNFYESKQLGPDSWSSSPREGLDIKGYWDYGGRIALLDTAFKDIKKGRIAIPIGFNDSGNKIIFAKSIKEFIERVGILLEQAEKWVSEQEVNLKSKTT